MECRRPQDFRVRALRMKRLSEALRGPETESTLPTRPRSDCRLTDHRPDCKQRGRTKGKQGQPPKPGWDQSREGTLFPEMNNAERGSPGGEELPLLPQPVPSQAALSRKPPS